MKVIALLVALAVPLAGCVSLSSSNPPPPRETVIVPR
jgi:hypothetical protein